MTEYITKEAAINAVENAPIELFQSEWNEIGEMINAVPAADVAPVVHGTWMHYGCDDEIVTCSRCGFEAYAEAFYIREGTHCPMCGARMDGGMDNV